MRKTNSNLLPLDFLVGAVAVAIAVFAVVTTAFLWSQSAAMTSLELEVEELKKQLDGQNNEVVILQNVKPEPVAAADGIQEFEIRLEEEELIVAGALLTKSEHQKVADLRTVIEQGQIGTFDRSDIRFAFRGVGAPFLRKQLVAAVERGDALAANSFQFREVPGLIEFAELTTEQALSLVARDDPRTSRIVLKLAKIIRTNGNLGDHYKRRIRDEFHVLLPLVRKYAKP